MSHLVFNPLCKVSAITEIGEVLKSIHYKYSNSYDDFDFKKVKTMVKERVAESTPHKKYNIYKVIKSEV